jgi:hypothetical protein
MTLVAEIRKSVTEATPLMAVVGVTDYAVERVRGVAANAAHLQGEVGKAVVQLEAKPKEWQARVRAMDVKLEAKTVQQAPVVVVHRFLEVVGKVEDVYGRLAVRGKDLVVRARRTAAAQDLARQSRLTVSRTRAVVTSARKTIDESASAAVGILTTGRREVVETASAVEAEVAGSVVATEKVVEERTRGTRAAVRGAAATVRERAAFTRTAARSATTSARKTVRKAVDAVEAVVGEVGEEPPTATVTELVTPESTAPKPAKKAASKATAKPVSKIEPKVEPKAE